MPTNALIPRPTWSQQQTALYHSGWKLLGMNMLTVRHFLNPANLHLSETLTLSLQLMTAGISKAAGTRRPDASFQILQSFRIVSVAQQLKSMHLVSRWESIAVRSQAYSSITTKIDSLRCRPHYLSSISSEFRPRTSWCYHFCGVGIDCKLWTHHFILS